MSHSEDGSMSQSSYGTGADTSVAGSEDRKALNDLHERNDDGIDSDLQGQNTAFEDAVFASMYTLSKNSKTSDIRWTAVRILVEFLQMFSVVFSTSFPWIIDTNIWIWKVLNVLLFRVLATEKGYGTFIAVFYVLAAFVLLTIAVYVWAAVVLNKNHNNSAWVRRLVLVLQFVAHLVFSVSWVAVLDYFSFLFSCRWGDARKPEGAMHLYFTDQNCLRMPHMAHMAFSAAVLLLHCIATLCMSVSDCDLNPLTRNHLASPVAITTVKTILLKMGLVILATALPVFQKGQSALMLVCAGFIVYYLLMAVPYYYDSANMIWIGLWTGILYTCILLVALENTMAAHVDDLLEYKVALTKAVLYGIFPAVLLGAGLCYLHLRHLRKPLHKLRAAYETVQQGVQLASLKDVHRFRREAEAEILLRSMRKWDEDGMPDPDATAFGEFIIKCAMARLPNRPYILTLFSNFIIELRKDGQAARTQLQLATKASPGILERYFIHVSHEVAKKLKAETEGLDLAGYVEFQRSYRACVRAHKLALIAQRQFWLSLLRNKVSFKELQWCLETVLRTEQQASAVYSRVLERYPTNGKLMKAYGRFLEFVRNEPWSANKYYTEAMKQGTQDSLLSLAHSSSSGETVNKFNTMLGNVDERVDGIVVINAAGIIMMVNGACEKMFGYSKGDLDGKNISMLMPQPYSSRHNSFLQRYVNTGQEHIVGTARQLVALHKDQGVFPIRLAVQRMSGIGADAMFMGMIRKHVADDQSVVMVYTTPNGSVLCADERFQDWFGIDSSALVGRSISTLTTDVEGFDRFIAQCSELPADQVLGGALCIHAKLMHKYLPPIEVEATVDFGGSDMQRILVVHLHCIAETQALLVTDTKGHIHFATNPLASMVGYNVQTLKDGMNLAGLLPPPYAQLHAGLMKDLSAKPPPGSCRSGAVVNMLHANNTKVPVTLQITQQDDGAHINHVIQVKPASAAQQLNQQRIELQVNHKGVVLSVNDGANKSVFGFNPAGLVGRPLFTFLNLFAEWRNKFEEDESLLVILGLAAQQNHNMFYRCGIHAPFTDEELRKGAAVGVGQGQSNTDNGLLGALKSRHKDRPAIMTLSLVDTDDEGDGANTASDNNAPMLTISLWRSEGLNSILEVDGALSILRAEPSAGLMFGLAHNLLLRKSFKSLASLPSCTQAADLLSGGAKKSMLKAGAAWRTGPVRPCEARHSDGAPMKLQIQAVSKDGKTTNRLLVMVRVLEVSTGSLQPLLALRASGTSGQPDIGKQLLAEQHSENEDELDDAGDGASEGQRAGSPELHDRIDSRLRVAEWVNTSFHKHDDEDQTIDKRQHDGKHSMKMATKQAEEMDDLQVHSKSGARKSLMELDGDTSGHGYVEVQMTGKPLKEQDTAVNFVGDAASDGGMSGGQGSVASGSQSGAGFDASTVASGMDDELVVDWRRAKRLKKLNRMMTSNTAQAAADRFNRHTYLATLFIVAAHVVCFVVLTTQVKSRHKTAFEVGDMAQGLEHSQMISLFANFIQKCGKPEFSEMKVCSPDRMIMLDQKIKADYDIQRFIHQGLYLGFDNLEMFDDPRLTEYWTYNRIPEYVWLKETQEGQHVTELGNTTLWEMGNKYLTCAKDIRFNAPELKYDLRYTDYYQYVQLNGPESLYQGYLWSLDVIVDYAWKQLGTLTTVLIVLLVVEAVAVLFTTISYEFFLLNAANCEAMKRYSVFLALPSATVRSMASRQMQVDDEDKSDIDDDDFETKTAVHGDNQGNADKTTGKDGQQSKTVRVAVALPDETGGNTARLSAPGIRGTKDGGKPLKNKSKWHSIINKMFGWMNTNFKINGKKLVPYNAVLWKFMVPLLLWVAFVIIIFGVSFQKIQGLEAPLASLHAAAHVRSGLARSRLFTTDYAFAETPEQTADRRARVKVELARFKKDYEIFMYGGLIPRTAQNLSFTAEAPAAAFTLVELSNLLFKTSECLRLDKTKCNQQGSEYYDITHAGLDAMVLRYIDSVDIFANVPDELLWPNHTSYHYINFVAAIDLYDGLQVAAQLLVDYTIKRYEAVNQLHIILLGCTSVLVLLFVAKMFRPYVSKLRTESKALAGMMSQLPAEVDIEGHVKLHVLGIRREDGKAPSLRLGSMNGGGGPAPLSSSMPGMRQMPIIPLPRLPAPPGSEYGGPLRLTQGRGQDADETGRNFASPRTKYGQPYNDDDWRE